MDSTERLGSVVRSGRAWVVAAVLATVAVVGGALAFPRLVYDRFIWQYFWGPIYADAHNAGCAVRSDGGVQLLSGDGCSQAQIGGQIVAEPGYTLVSEAGYAVILIFMLVGVLFFLRRLDLGSERRLFYALVPFMFFGGALRVVEDATDAAFAANAGEIIGYPLNTLIISPIIYFVVFLITLGAILFGIALVRGSVVRSEQFPAVVGAIGTAAVAVTVGSIWAIVASIDTSGTSAGFYPQLPAVVLVLSVLIAVGLYAALDRAAPWVNAGTGLMGLVVLFAQALDGVANVIAADWMGALGLGFLDYGAKHPINRIIIDLTGVLLPQSAIDTIGTAWPFLLVKLIAAVAVIALFDDRIFEDSKQYAMLLLVAIVAVGLGPGTRDMLRATFGI